MSWGDTGSSAGNDNCTKMKYGISPYGLHCASINMTRDDIKNGKVTTTFSDCNKNGTEYNSGLYCAALIMYDGWQIKDDYPW